MVKPGPDRSKPGYSMEPDAGSISLRWGTRSRRLGTSAELAFEVVLWETAEPPEYQEIAEKALQLNNLGLSNESIALHVGVDGKTVAKALSWILDRS
jgi:hypothetical protein